jgi:HK97 family phage major capsid protein
MMDQVDIKTLVGEAMKEAFAPIAEKLNEKKEVVVPQAKVELSNEEKLGKFIRGVYQMKKFGNVSEIEEVSGKAVSSLTDGAGGYTVPEVWASSIIRATDDYGVARRLARIVPMTSDTLNLPAGSGKATAALITQLNQITGSEPTFTSIQLVAKKIAGTVVISNEILADSSSDISAYVANDLGRAVALAEDTYFIDGNASPAIDGVLLSSAVGELVMSSGDTSFLDLSFDYLVELTKKVPHQDRRNARFLMSDSVWGLVQKLKDEQNMPIFQQLNASEQTTILGYPVVISDVMPTVADDAVETSFIAFGDFSGVAMGMRKELSVDVATEGTVDSVNLFEQDASAIRVIERIDFKITSPEKIAKLTTAAA